MKHRPLRRTRAHLDDVLDGRAPAGDPLVDLVAAVRAPAHRAELTGLDAALAAFVSASSVAPSPEEKTPMLKSVAGRLLALKVLAAVAGTAAAGGVAYAAVNGNLEHSPNGNSAAVAGKSAGAPSRNDESSSTGSDDSSSASGTASQPSESASGTESGSEGPKGTPSPSLQGLCTAWLAHPRDIAKVSGNPAFSVLITAAGGADAVNAYCTSLLATAHPSHPAHPTQAQNTKPKPSQASTHATGKPSSMPAKSKKSTHPTPAVPTGRHSKSD